MNTHVRQLLLICFLVTLAFVSSQSAQQSMAQPQATPVEIKIAPTAFDPYVGQYEDATNRAGTVFSFFRESDKFFLQVTNQERIEIFPSGESKFFLKIFTADAEFLRDSSGLVTGMIWRQGDSEFRTKKIADQPAKDTRVTFVRTEAMIPMRDGVKLFTVILTPENQTQPLPILMARTPYGVKGWNSAGLNGSRPELVRDGYIFVFQDIRGRTDSEGVFEMVRPPRDKRDAKATDESTDTYDTIDYLVKNVPKNNGRVGIAGVSNDDFHLPRLQKADSIVIVSGQGSYEAPDRSRELSGILHSKGIPHMLELWGHDVAHDWPWWRKMLPYYLGKFLNG